jgi:alkylation response protein AidB-like acyl-CoA dehydrogenase
VNTIDCVRWLLSSPVGATPIDDIDAWWDLHTASFVSGSSPVIHALRAGFSADRLGWAFASGYEAALRALLRDPGPPRLRALCATEAGGNHPRAIETELRDLGDGTHDLRGSKTFVTMGPRVEELLVVAHEGIADEASSRRRLRCVRIPANRAGVGLATLSALPFVPEIPHARLELAGVVVASDEWLPGDGYTNVLKPFRTLEDAHVFAAIIGHAIRMARRLEAGPDAIERWIAWVPTIVQVARAETALDPTVHRLLAAVIDGARRELERFEGSEAWTRAGAPTRERWSRDRAILQVAETARSRRLEVARRASAET